jgi:hypothetical protein
MTRMAHSEPTEEHVMLNRKALFSLFAVAAFAAAAALTVNSASAAPPKGPGIFKGNVGKGGGGGAWKGPKGPGVIKGPIVKLPPKLKPKLVIKPKLVLKPYWCWKHPWFCRRPIRIVKYPIITTGVVATGVAAAAVSRPAPTCTCLTKQYLPDGSVMFKDVCTQEVAVNPPPGQQAQVQ